MLYTYSFSCNFLYVLFQTDFDEFWESFIKYLKFSLVVYKREQVVERTLDFAATFATSLGSKPKKEEKKEEDGEQEEEEEDEEMEPFLKKFFDFLLSVSCQLFLYVIIQPSKYLN